MCVNDLPKVALDSAAAGIEPAISNRTSNARTAMRHRATAHSSKITMTL